MFQALLFHRCIYLEGMKLIDYIENKIEKLDRYIAHDYSIIKLNEVCVY